MGISSAPKRRKIGLRNLYRVKLDLAFEWEECSSAEVCAGGVVMKRGEADGEEEVYLYLYLKRGRLCGRGFLSPRRMSDMMSFAVSPLLPPFMITVPTIAPSSSPSTFTLETVLSLGCNIYRLGLAKRIGACRVRMEHLVQPHVVRSIERRTPIVPKA